MKRNPYALASVLLLSGCALKGGWLMTVGPDYQAPEPPLAKQWQAAQTTTAHHAKPLSAPPTALSPLLAGAPSHQTNQLPNWIAHQKHVDCG